MTYNFKLEILEQVFLEYSYSKKQLTFLKKANQYWIKHIKKYIKQQTKKV